MFVTFCIVFCVHNYINIVFFFLVPTGRHPRQDLTYSLCGSSSPGDRDHHRGRPANKNSLGMGMQCKKLDAAVYKFIHDVSSIALRVFVLAELQVEATAPATRQPAVAISAGRVWTYLCIPGSCEDGCAGSQPILISDNAPHHIKRCELACRDN